MNAFALVTLGVAIFAMGLYVANADDAPGAAVIGMLLMVTAVVLAVRAARHRLPTWASRTALAIGIGIAAFAAVLTHGVVVTAPLFAQPQAIPSSAATPPRAQHAATVDRARALVRTAIRAQNLPGVSVAVGVGGDVVWAEGFGWRDVPTQTPVTPRTRFHIGTAAPAIAGAVRTLGLDDTGADAAADWSPEHVGEPEEDFPLFTMVRHVVLGPLGIVPPQPLAGERATFYVPRTGNDPARGRQLMYMRDLACCMAGKAFSSTPSDLVRVALATRTPDLEGALAGGTVMSLVTMRDGGVVVAVASNIAHARTSALAVRIGEAFGARAQ